MTDDSNIAPTDANLLQATGLPTWTPTATTQENLPINTVNWYEAYAFCIWDGGFLPSEAEWEYAAAGGSQQREYPWGWTAPGTESEYAIYDCDYASSGGLCSSVAYIAEVGTTTLGAGLWGQLDMAGDVWEWNLDWYNSSYADPCTDCAYLAAESSRGLRGGCFYSLAALYLFAPDRFYDTPANRRYYSGFRRARTP